MKVYVFQRKEDDKVVLFDGTQEAGQLIIELDDGTQFYIREENEWLNIFRVSRGRMMMRPGVSNVVDLQ